MHGGYKVSVPVGIFPPHNRGLESLRQVNRMDASLRAPEASFAEHGAPVPGLGVNKVGKLQEPLFSGNFVEPQHHLKVVGAALLSPERPVVQGLFRQRLQLVAEVLCEAVDYAGVSRCRIILLQDIQRHHLRPPVMRFPPLEAIYIGVVFGRAEIPVLLLRGQHCLHPRLRLGLESGIVKDIGKRQQPVYPVGAPLPSVSVTAKPGVGRAHHLRIYLVQMAREAAGLPLQLLQQPAFGLYGAKRKLLVLGGGSHRYQNCQGGGKDSIHG